MLSGLLPLKCASLFGLLARSPPAGSQTHILIPYYQYRIVKVTEAVEKVVVARARGMCELCGEDVVEDNKMTGVIAHIQGHNPTSARYNANMSESERNSPENLILLCGSCHIRVDKNPEKYTTEHLLDMRNRHANKWALTVGKAMPDIEFPELDEAVRYIATIDIPLEYSYTLVPPGEKIRKNCLSPKLVTMGLSQSNTVGRYMDKHVDAESGRRLRAGFVKRYRELRGEGLDGNYLFDVLWQFASRHNADPKIQAAGLALLVYLFEKCEVFEK